MIEQLLVTGVNKNTTPYKGLILPSNFITGSALCTLAGISALSSDAGTTTYILNDQVNWMHYIDPATSKEFYISQKTITNRQRRTELSTAGVITGKTLVIGGKNYNCRLMTSAEWNKWIYGVYHGINFPLSGGPTVSWANFDENALVLCQSAVVAGGISHVQDTNLTRGYPNITGSLANNESGPPYVNGYGWRPMLEVM